ncbi:hypothetical protein JCM10212_006818 [Sporobolomyces blumeae]
MEDYFAFQPFGVHNDDDDPAFADDLPTPAAHAGYLSPFDSPSPTFPDPETPKVRRESRSRTETALRDDPASEKEANEATRKKPTLSPSELVTVLDRDGSPPPPVTKRWLHGGQPLNDLDAPSVVMPNSEKGKDKPVANSEWRAFTDDEEGKLQRGWALMHEEKEARKADKRSQEDRERRDGKSGTKVVTEHGGRKRLADNAIDTPDPVHLIPVGLDNLFTVDLESRILFPAFWASTPVRMILAHWFYAPPTVGANAGTLASHQLKPYPVDPSLSSALDRAYADIRPWDTSYDAELKSALKGGSEAQKRLCVPLGLENESGADASADLGIEVIFEGGDRGRVYSKGMIGSVAKSFWSSGRGLGGGQIVLRGWDAFRRYMAEQAEKKKKPAKARPGSLKSDNTASESEGEARASGRSTSQARARRRSGSAGSQVRTESPASGFFSSLRNRFVGTATSADGQPSAAEPEGRKSTEAEGAEVSSSASANETQEALEGPRKEDADPSTEEGARTSIGEVDELVLVVHGVGQQLAQRYESFNFTLAVNQFRSACTTLSTSPTLSPLLHGKRAQFIPVLWRADLDFDAVDDSADSADEHLQNRFSIQDIEIQNSVPFLRTIVSGLVLDVPFYLSPAHKEKMIKAVVRESNRIYRLFCKRNPTFSGKVSIIGHSLGSCIVADILSNQPTTIAEADGDEALKAAQAKDLAFCFDTRVLILVGSPLAFFLHLGKGQLIARSGRERTKGVDKDVALDRAGRYGCLAVDAVYNVYHESDPVAFSLNPCVDVRYSKLIKPVPIPSSNQTLLQNLSSAYYRVSKIFDVSSLWGPSKATGAQAKEQAEEQKKETDEAKDKADETKRRAAGTARPGNKRMPSEMPRFKGGRDEFEWVGRAERRFKALNPSGTVDYYLPAEGINQYLDALTAHQDYWEDRRFSTFVLTNLFSSQEELERAGRNEIGEEAEE